MINSHAMSADLEVIANELRRLQREGVNRVFVEDHTISLLVPAPRRSTAKNADTSTETTNPPAQVGDLRDLANEAPKAETPQPVAQKASPPVPEPPLVQLPEGDAETQLAALKEQILNCKVCNEHLSEDGQVVFGSGSPDADIFFCGEAPGADEARAGEPFVGKPGQLLSKIITTMGLSRERIYLANALNWRPEHDKPYGNRPPTIEEIKFCLPYLQAQIEIVRPKVIVALGNTAVSSLLGADPSRKLGAVRGTWSSFADIPLMITFHPSYLLRSDTLKTKRMVWEDMLQVMEKCELEISDKQRGFFLPKS